MTALKTVCPQCGSINRLAAERLGDNPRCGQCHLPLFGGHPAQADDHSFSRLLKHEDLPVVVDFWAGWCAPCKAMAPIFEAITAATEPQARFVKVDTEKAPRLSQQFAIRSIPSFMIFKNGKQVAQQAGGMPAVDFQRWVNQHL